MPRIKAVTDANGTKFYPSSITHAVYDTDRNQKLTATLGDIEAKADNALVAIGYQNMVDISFEVTETGAFNMIITTPDE